MQKRAEITWIVLGFAALAVAYTFPLILNLRSHLPNDLGDPLLSTWTLAWDANRIQHGLRGVWDAPNFFPYRHTLLYSDHLLGIAILTAPLDWLTRNPVLVYNVAFLGSFVLAGGGMYVLAREQTRRRDAAVVAALIFACQPFRISHIAHLQWLMTGWLPLSLWSLHRYGATSRFRYLLGCTAAFLIAALTASYLTYFALLPLAAVAGRELWRRRPPAGLAARHAAIAAAVVAVVMLPVAKAYYQVRVDSGVKRRASEIAEHSADVGDYFSAPPRMRVWADLGGGRGEHELFPGAAALVLAALAVVAMRRSGSVPLYAGVAAAAFVLSLGPEPKAWGHSLGIPGPYAALLKIIPGLDGLRAPARLAVVVQTAIAMLAAFGVVWLCDRLRPALWPVCITAGAAAIVVLEGWPQRIDTPAFDPRGAIATRDAYEYLRHLPAGAVMELPTAADRPEKEFVYQYMTLVHGHPIVNGHSGYVSPLLLFLGGGGSPLGDLDHVSDAVEMLRTIGVRYLVLHRGSFDDAPTADAWVGALGDRRQVLTARSFGDTEVAVLLPAAPLPPPGQGGKIPVAAMRATASQSGDRLANLFDGDLDTRWLSGGQQAGDEWIEVQFDRPRDVREVDMQLVERSFGDYPRQLAVDVVEEDGTRTVFRGPVLPQFARGLVVDPVAPVIAVALPPNRARALRLRQLGTTRRFFWSVHELELREARP